MLKENNENVARNVIKDIAIEFVEIDEEIAIESAIFRRKNKDKSFSYADCIGYVTALRGRIKFLTGDKGFKNFKNVEFVK